MGLNVKENGLLVALNAFLFLAFLVYHVGLDQYYCLSADDFAGIDYGSKGILGFSYAWRFYFEWEGPFLSYFGQGLLLGSVAAGMPPFIGLLVVKLAMVGSTTTLLCTASNRFQFDWGFHQTVFFALIFSCCLYSISPEVSEIWHWLVGSVYLMPLISLQLGIAALLRNKFWWAIVALAFVMQSRATYAVLIFGFIVLLTMYFYWRKEENREQWILISVFLFLFLALYLIAPGNYVRMKDHGNELPLLIAQFKIGLKNLFVSYNIAKMDRVLLGLLVVLPWVGFQQKTSRPKHLWHWAIPAILYVGFAVSHETLFVYITGCREWERVLSLHSFLFLSMMFVYGFWIFSFVPVSWKKSARAVSFLGVGGLLFQLFGGYGQQLEMGKELKAKYDARMVSILEHDGISDTLYLQPMNYTGILYFDDFSEDPDHWINYDFRKAYNLDFKVALQPESHD